MFPSLYLKYSIRQREKADIANICGKLKQCDRKPLSAAQKKEIQDFYRPLVGHEVPTYWHEYFYSRNENFSVRYIPTSFYHKEIIYRLNNYQFRHAYVDKGIYDIYFPDLNRPKTIVKNMNGYFYDDRHAISREEALDRCRNLAGVVAKPTLEGMWGEGVRVFSTVDGRIDDKTSVADLFDSYGKNFIVQEKVCQHADMARLNPTSLNTLRILSYRQDNIVHILYAVVRIGRTGQCVDNETAGGINADIQLSNGTILDCAYGTPAEKKIFTTDNGTVLKGFQIPAFDKALDIVREMHLRLPYFNLVGWDFGIDQNSEPVMIEWNRAPDLSQTAHGPAFGDLTETIITTALRNDETMK